MGKYWQYIQATKRADIDYTLFEGTPFRCDTGTSYGNNFLDAEDLAHYQETRNRTGEIVMLSPDDYFWMCSMYGFHHYVPESRLRSERRQNTELIEKYKSMMQSGVKFDMCYINKADKSQEGLHRMMAAGDLYGWKTLFPVLVIEVYDAAVEARRKLVAAANDYRDDKFHKLCSWAAHCIHNYRAPVPTDFIEQYRRSIMEQFYDSLEYKFGDITNIEFDIEVEGDIVRVYLDKYNDYEFPTRYNPYETSLSDMYDTEGLYANINDISDTDLDDIDLSDLLP